MKRKTQDWKIKDIYEVRELISFPDYQREPKLWSLQDKQLLIDSILHDIDIPKIYFNKAGDEYEVIDGQQRLWAIWQFIDNEYTYKTDDKKLKELKDKCFEKFSNDYRQKILNYELQITEISNASEDYLRELFLRLQLGLLLVTGEKLHASTGMIKDFIFDKMVKHPFIEGIKISSRRYAKQTLCAQICINSLSKYNIADFSRTRYEDLKYFFEDYKKLDGGELEKFNIRCSHIIKVLDVLNEHFSGKYDSLRNRSFILSVYLFIEDIYERQKSKIEKIMPDFVKFVGSFWHRLKEEAEKGIDRENKDLYAFDKHLSNAPGEKYQIKNRHEELEKFFDYFQKTGQMLSDQKK